MCGIFGIVSNQSRAELEAPVRRAVAALAHRGPDDDGIEFIDADGLTVAFGHRRLSILDLSPAGHQPMRDEQTGDWITHNGEVFNFREARARLVAEELRFASDGDTEVLLKGFGLLGKRAIDDWRGMFAFGLWRARERELVLVRDRLGIKPLYYFHDGQTLLFASELRALLATGLVPRRISPAALDSYLAFGSVQQPLTMIEGVRALLPGHTLRFKDGRVHIEQYWQPRTSGEGEVDPDEIAALIEESVKLRLVSDVPVGLFLSGGIDSSVIAALAQRHSARPIQSFSVCFQEQEFSEQQYAERVARQYGTAHQSILVTEMEALAAVPRALVALDQPSIDGVNTFIVSEAVAQAGLKVALSGAGGDELFAGYRFFQTIARDERLRQQVQAVPAGLRRAAVAGLSAMTTNARAAKVGALLADDASNQHTVFLRRQLFSHAQRRELLRVPAETDVELAAWTRQQLGACAEADAINQASALELGGYLTNTLLRDTDAMSMRHGLEVRVPLIDHRLVERVLALPGSAKLRAGEPKWLLRAAVPDLPREIIDRPKRGFELPFKLWLSGALREPVEAALSSPRLADLCEPRALQSVWQNFLNGRATWSRPWSFVVLDQWLARNLDGTEPGAVANGC